MLEKWPSLSEITRAIETDERGTVCVRVCGIYMCPYYRICVYAYILVFRKHAHDLNGKNEYCVVALIVDCSITVQLGFQVPGYNRDANECKHYSCCHTNSNRNTNKQRKQRANGHKQHTAFV